MNGFLRKAIVIAAVGAFLSCSAAGQTETESAVAEEYSAGFAADAAAAPMMKAMRSANQSDAVPERKIVYRADLTIETTDLVGTREKILDLTESENGILEYNEQNEQQFYLSLKIPAEKFEEFLNEAKAVGRVIYSSISANDVTEQYIDTETRLASKRALLEKYQSYLPQAKDLKEILEVEAQINSVTTELEQWEGRLQRLEKEVAYSSVSVRLKLPTYVEKEDDAKTIADLFLSIGKNLRIAFAYIALGLIYIAAVGGPFIAAVVIIALCIRIVRRKKRGKTKA